MKLLKLEAFGFKSFADKTELVFDEGTTVIVGPNGCGKSNVVDSFKWVLGEQSAKSLRGDGMQDVIFNGSGGRKPAGMAQVILTFDNSDRRLPVEQTEVSVGRRLYRDGTSEYLLNKKVVRLRDIKELFMDTGVGVDAYSLVEQGKVDQVLASNATERRAIFEEAAGISKYRARKREAERKLERVQQNLLRLTDIIGEVDRRLRTIKAAATRARNYQEYDQRLRELRVSHYLFQYHKLTEGLAEAQRLVAEAQDLVARHAATQSQATARLEELDDRQLSLAGELADLDNRLVQVASQVANHRDRIHYAAEREKELAAELTARRGGLVGLYHRINELAAHERDLNASAAELDAAAETGRSRIEAIGRDQHALDVELNEIAAASEQTSAALFDLVRKTAQLNNTLHEHKTAQANLSAQQERLGNREREIDDHLERRRRQRETCQAEIARIDAELADLHSQVEQAKSAAAAKGAAIRELSERLGNLKDRRASLNGRRDLLVAMERRLEGLADGPADLLRRQAEADAAPDGNNPRIDGLAGLVADLFTVAPEDAAIVQTALGDRDQWIVVRQGDALAAEPARLLLDSLAGEVTLICLDRLSPATPDLSPWLNRPGVIGPVSQKALCQPVFLGVRDLLLGRALLVESLEVATQLAAEALNNSQLQFITPDGYRVSADGRVTAPGRREAAADQSPATIGLIGRKAELRALNEQLETLTGRVAQVESELSAESAEAAQIEQVQQELRSQVYQRSTERVEISGQLRQAEGAIDELLAEQKLLAGEVEELVARRHKAAVGQTQVEEELAHLERRRHTLATQAEEFTDRLSGRRARAEQLTRAITEAKVELGQVEERRLGVRSQLGAVRRGLSEQRSLQAAARSDCRSLAERIAQSQQAQLNGEAAIASLFVQKQSLGDARVVRAGELSEVRRELGDLEEAARAASHQLHAAEESLHETQVAQNEQRVRQEDLVQRVGEDHGIDLPQLYQTQRPSEGDLSVDWNAVEAEIADLRGKIERLGNVNLDAIAEQEQLESRSTFLHGQLGDVERAREQLASLIERINNESRKRFAETFAQVQEHFRELFRKLFGGGKADLVMENPDDLLESGIEIIARPPGKELRSISLLSGGEKTMTALALLLAIFRSKPSPFCILDEVDAALDEANNERFNQLILEFTSFSQFIIITHSKRTMTVANTLYGITMQEQGVSRRVAVRFDGRTVRGEEGETLEAAESAPAVA
ncbi:MAG: Chromosome partition protein Smc [Phycisphaerae bacterium]|nr:Chromosome partition protein Smc [Phycisphaerae bacterium]